MKKTDDNFILNFIKESIIFVHSMLKSLDGQTLGAIIVQMYSKVAAQLTISLIQKPGLLGERSIISSYWSTLV